MSSPFRQNVTFPIGRLVWGHPGQTRDKDRTGKPLVTKDGKPRIECAFGVAYEKKGTQAFWQTDWGATVYNTGRAAFPNLFQADGSLLPGRKFSFKIVDGDSVVPNENGTIPNQQEGYAGHWVVTFKCGYVSKCYVNRGTDALPVWEEINPSTIKTGDFVQVAGSVDSNGDANKSGVYINHGMISHAGTGKEIVTGPNVASVGFGQGPKPVGMGALPTGGAMMPGGGTPAPAAGLPPAPTGQPLPSATPGPIATGAQQPLPLPTTVTPHPGILGAGVPVPGAPGTAGAPPAPAAAPPAGPVMTAKANGVPWSSFLAQNWTEEAARREGYIV
jgi:hypothetical protein